jgi:hypothetical protein
MLSRCAGDGAPARPSGVILGYSAGQGKDPRDLRVQVGLRFSRIALQMVAGR